MNMIHRRFCQNLSLIMILSLAIVLRADARQAATSVESPEPSPEPTGREVIAEPVPDKTLTNYTEAGGSYEALSNKFGAMVLPTGNKSELAVGYSTIYGDAVGGFAPMKDVPKSLVWAIARWRNEVAESHAQTPPIPPNSIAKPPSAELRPGQTLG